jgi:hypothetical protein
MLVVAEEKAPREVVAVALAAVVPAAPVGLVVQILAEAAARAVMVRLVRVAPVSSSFATPTPARLPSVLV